MEWGCHRTWAHHKGDCYHYIIVQYQSGMFVRITNMKLLDLKVWSEDIGTLNLCSVQCVSTLTLIQGPIVSNRMDIFLCIQPIKMMN